MREHFSKLAQTTVTLSSSPAAFAIAVLVVLVWAASGPLFGYSDTWQLIINTGTTVITFLMVFLIQHSQDRDTRAIQLKLDELLRATSAARNELVNLESLSDDELEKMREQFARLQRMADKRRGERERVKP